MTICEKCAFWEPDATVTKEHRSPYGECRRNAPRLRLSRHDSAEAEAVWPPTSAAQWCGEWRPKAGELPLGKGAAA